GPPLRNRAVFPSAAEADLDALAPPGFGDLALELLVAAASEQRGERRFAGFALAQALEVSGDSRRAAAAFHVEEVVRDQQREAVVAVRLMAGEFAVRHEQEIAQLRSADRLSEVAAALALFPEGGRISQRGV